MSSSVLKRKAPASTEANKKAKTNANIMSFFGPPKPVANGGATAPKAAAAPEPAMPKFDKAKWAAGLTAEQKKLLQLEIDTLDASWLAHLKDDITSKEFLDLKRFLEREADQGKKIFPPREDIYSWSRLTPFNSVKVVILGQDPYHNHNQAHGLAFSVRPPTPAPPSLRNMFIALKKDCPTFEAPPNKGGLLTPWADRGVLLLNTCLTVRAHEANSHANRGWERFTQRVIDLVAAKRTRGVVFMAWGTPAGKRVLKIDAKRHLVLKSVHPSPLSAARGFFDCGHFRKANDWLVTRYGEGHEIDWDLSPAPERKKQAEKAEKTKDNAGALTPTEEKNSIVEDKAAAATLNKKPQAGKPQGDDDEDKENVADAPPAAVGAGKESKTGVEEKSKALSKEGENPTVTEEK